MLFQKYIIAATLMTAALSCKKDKVFPAYEPPAETKFNIYPKPTTNTATGSTTGWVGDVMPYYFNGQFEIFYLHDAPDQVKQSSAGQHAIHRFTSKNLLDFNDLGEAIPYGNVNTQDHLIGTGSVVKAGDTYYYYYTGFNGNTSWLQNNNPGWTIGNTREAVMYATSKDLKTWTKKSSFILRASEDYSGTDFRDPYVFYNAEFSQYWMLVSTKKNGKGVILVYTTDNPAGDNWTIRGPLEIDGDYLMLECPDIIKAGDQYYLFFSEDWSSTPGTHYRVASSTAGPWLKPASGYDMFDGHQFYAARPVSNGTNFYTLGWAHRRASENDGGALTWAGNLISHEFAPGTNGLTVKIPAPVEAYFKQDSDPGLNVQSGMVSHSGSDYTLNGSASTALCKFSPFSGTSRIKGTIRISNLTGTASIGFNTSTGNASSYIIRLEPGANRIAAYNNGVEVTRVPFSFEANKTYSFSLVADGSVAVLYFDNTVALTNRIYSMQDMPWSIAANNLSLSVTNLKLSK